MSKQIIEPSDFYDETMRLYNIETFINRGTINIEQLKTFIIENNINKDNTKFITSFATKTKIFNTTSLNNILQDIFNPNQNNSLNDMGNSSNYIIPSNNKYEDSITFRINDKIIRTENDYSNEKMRANGEEAIIKEFDGIHVTINYSGVNDKPEKIAVDVLYDSFMLNYCVTIHKSQGSQYPNVVFFIESNQSFTDKKSIYTAISRAKEKCFVISKEEDFVRLQKNNGKLEKVSVFMNESNNYNL